MGLAYLAGFCLFIGGIMWSNIIVLQIASTLLLITAALYNFNVVKMLLHKAVIK